MGKLEVEKVKQFQLNILKELERLCQMHDLYYTAAFGTVIGAVRHGGFIPWDDDIDIYMKWEDYKKLEDIAAKELGSEFYFQSRKNNPQNFVYWNRIGLKNTTSIDKNLAHIHADWGICIDIFPLLPLGNTQEEVEEGLKIFRKINKYCLKYLMLHSVGGTASERLKRKLHGLIPDSVSVSLTEHYLEKLGNKGMESTKYCTSGTGGYILETSWFKETTVVPFEDGSIPIMKGYDEYLRKIYGDYMTLPPEEQRVCHINDNIIIKFDEPYQNYCV